LPRGANWRSARQWSLLLLLLLLPPLTPLLSCSLPWMPIFAVAFSSTSPTADSVSRINLQRLAEAEKRPGALTDCLPEGRIAPPPSDPAPPRAAARRRLRRFRPSSSSKPPPPPLQKKHRINERGA
jgi:hypothetical protein